MSVRSVQRPTPALPRGPCSSRPLGKCRPPLRLHGKRAGRSHGRSCWDTRRGCNSGSPAISAKHGTSPIILVLQFSMTFHVVGKSYPLPYHIYPQNWQQALQSTEKYIFTAYPACLTPKNVHKNESFGITIPQLWG